MGRAHARAKANGSRVVMNQRDEEYGVLVNVPEEP